MGQKITTFLWFDKQAEEAMNFYVSLFKDSPAKGGADSEIVNIQYYPEGYSEGPMAGMEGKVLTGIFKLAGQQFMALDGGPVFRFTEAMSLLVACEDQAEIDYFWDRLSAVPESEQCGWLKDKYGVSWQIVPKDIEKWMNEPDPQKAKRAMDAMLQMKKIDIAQLDAALKG